MPFTIIRQDITKMQVDAIVNAANTNLLMGGGVCGAIFKAAGAIKLQCACKLVAPIKTGQAAITSGFNLPAKYVIHTAGPIYKDWSKEENEKLLYSAYTESMKLALQHNCSSIAFPLISSGIYGYPKAKAFRVAKEAIKAFIFANDMDVYLTILDKDSIEISQELLDEVQDYVDAFYEEIISDGTIKCDFKKSLKYLCCREREGCLCDVISHLDAPFSYSLANLIALRGLKNTDVYKRANIDRKYFSKIIGTKNYVPSKRTVLALAIGLRLTIDETNEFLKKAGYAFSPSQKFDVIVEYFINNKIYDIFEINEVLFKYDQPLLGSK